MPNRRRIGIALALASMATWVVLWSGPRDDPASPAGTGCLLCHDNAVEGPAGLHASIPCELCHLGDPEGTTVLTGHDGLEMETGALDIVDQTCGQCHEREVERVRGSLMATARGLISVNRWSFGELDTPDGHETITDLLAEDDPTPAQDHLRRLCAGCHLGARRDNRDDAIHPSEGSGCSACHTGPKTGEAHSTVVGEVPDDRCFGCHSRSARISLTYQGLAEVSGEWEDACDVTETLPDGRTVCRTEPDVHHAAGMQCTDCHLHTELMGDGETYLHEGDAVEISCQSCHGPVDSQLETIWDHVQDSITTVLLRVNLEWRPDDERVRTGRRGTPLWNVRPPREPVAPWLDGTWVLRSKANGRPMPVKPTPRDIQHTMLGHERLSCAACHSAIAPTCTTCHTTFDPDDEQWDFGVGGMSPGRWIETDEGMGFAAPGLAIGPDGRIRPAIPGMDGTLDARAAGGRLREIHLFSVLDPHSTTLQGRTCAECHLDEGIYVDGVGTRTGARALTAGELAKVLRVGPCLECHDEVDGIDWWYDSFELVMTGLDPGHPETDRR